LRAISVRACMGKAPIYGAIEDELETVAVLSMPADQARFLSVTRGVRSEKYGPFCLRVGG
jgi:hypothetical protein